MIRTQKVYGWCRKGLQIRYRPRPRISSGLVSAAPWINVVVLVAAFVMLASHLVLRPGVVIHPPDEKVLTGTRYGLTAVILSRESSGKKGRDEIVFFDDNPFDVKVAGQMAKLRSYLSTASRRHQDIPLIIEADLNVKHGTIMTICKMAANAGFKEVNLATRTGGDETGE